MFDFLERATRTAANVVTLPVSVAADVVTMGGALSDRDESYTGAKAERVVRDGKRLLDDIDG